MSETQDNPTSDAATGPSIVARVKEVVTAALPTSNPATSNVEARPAASPYKRIHAIINPAAGQDEHDQANAAADDLEGAPEGESQGRNAPGDQEGDRERVDHAAREDRQRAVEAGDQGDPNLGRDIRSSIRQPARQAPTRQTVTEGCGSHRLFQLLAGEQAGRHLIASAA